MSFQVFSQPKRCASSLSNNDTEGRSATMQCSSRWNRFYPTMKSQHTPITKSHLCSSSLLLSIFLMHWLQQGQRLLLSWQWLRANMICTSVCNNRKQHVLVHFSKSPGHNISHFWIVAPVVGLTSASQGQLSILCSPIGLTGKFSGDGWVPNECSLNDSSSVQTAPFVKWKCTHTVIMSLTLHHCCDEQTKANVN